MALFRIFRGSPDDLPSIPLVDGQTYVCFEDNSGYATFWTDVPDSNNVLHRVQIGTGRAIDSSVANNDHLVTGAAVKSYVDGKTLVVKIASISGSATRTYTVPGMTANHKLLRWEFTVLGTQNTALEVVTGANELRVDGVIVGTTGLVMVFTEVAGEITATAS